MSHNYEELGITSTTHQRLTLLREQWQEEDNRDPISISAGTYGHLKHYSPMLPYQFQYRYGRRNEATREQMNNYLKDFGFAHPKAAKIAFRK